MTTTTHEWVAAHPETGEVLDQNAALLVAEAIGLELVAAQRAATEAENEARSLERRVAWLKNAIRGLIPVEGRVKSGTAWIVVQPGRPGRRAVNALACDAYREQLLSLNLGRVESKFHAPRISEVDAARAELTAAGVPISAIAPTPDRHPPEVVIVDTEVPF